MTSERSISPFAALLLAAGLALCGWFVGGGIRYFKDAERYVSVKGLAEREVAANLAIWPIVYTVSGNDLSELQGQLEADGRKVADYLRAQGFAESDFSVAAPRVTDNAPQGGVDGRAPRERYQVETTTILRTGKVADAEMWRTFNCGIGYVLILPASAVDSARTHLDRADWPSWVIHAGTRIEGGLPSSIAASRTVPSCT